MQASRQAMAEMVHEIFSRLDVIPEPPASPFAQAASAVPRLQVSPVPSRAGGASMDAEGVAAAEAGEAESSPAVSAAEQAAPEAVQEAGQQQAAAREASLGMAEGQSDAAAAPEAAGGAAATSDGAVAAEGTLVADAEAVAAAAAADELPPLQSPTTVLSLLPAVQANPTEQEGYGVEAVREVLLFIISLIGSGGQKGGDRAGKGSMLGGGGGSGGIPALWHFAVGAGQLQRRLAKLFTANVPPTDPSQRVIKMGAACRGMQGLLPASPDTCPGALVAPLQPQWERTRTCRRMVWT